MKIRDFYTILREASEIDIYDLNYVFSSSEINLLEYYSPRTFSGEAGVLGRIAVFFLHLFKNVFIYRYVRFASFPEHAPVFCFGTLNQRNALTPMAENTSAGVLVGMDILSKASDVRGARAFPIAWSYILSLFFFPFVLYHFITARGYQKQSYRIAFDYYWLAYGHYIACRLWLRKTKPSVVTVANDHMTYTRALVAAAKTEGIPTCYVQHASVTAKFPPLIFDYALLEGKDALLKYDRGLSNTKVFLIGMPKADQYFPHINTSTSVKRVGICANPLDTVSRVEELLEYLTQNCLYTSFVLRPHPGDVEREAGIWHKMANKYNIEFSDARHEFIFDFLRQVGAIIGANSSVLLEAALLNVVPLYYDLSGKDMLDYYGYVQSGLARRIDRVEDMVAYLHTIYEKKPNVRQCAKYYCATVNTSYDGHSAKLASNVIEQVIRKGSVDLKNWRETCAVSLVAYEPCDSPVFTTVSTNVMKVG